MRRRFGAMLVAVAAGLAIGGGAATAAVEDGPAGKWTWTFQRPGGGEGIEVTLTLMQEGEELTGTVSGRGGQETEIKEGTFKDGEVSFVVERERDGNVFKTYYKGQLEGDTITGTTEMEFNGERRSREWVAKRAG